MNGIGIPISATQPEFEAGANALIAFSKKSMALSDWGHLQTRALFESVPAWADRKVITVIEWEKKFKASKKHSRAAFAAYFGVDELRHYQSTINRYGDSGDITGCITD
jgi:hypothetical protein